MEISKLSSNYDIQRLNISDANSIMRLCHQNRQYYGFCGAEPTWEQVLSDIQTAPPGVPLSDKYYVGFYERGKLIAIMDLIDGYPKPEMAFIGFFMLDMDLQGHGLGSSIIQETASYLKILGKTAIRLGIDKGNPQSTYFWKKNGFVSIKEVDREGWTIILAEKKL